MTYLIRYKVRRRMMKFNKINRYKVRRRMNSTAPSANQIPKGIKAAYKVRPDFIPVGNWGVIAGEFIHRQPRTELNKLRSSFIGKPILNYSVKHH